MNRAVSFEYMNRQLVWNEFSVKLLQSCCSLTNSWLSKRFLACLSDYVTLHIKT